MSGACRKFVVGVGVFLGLIAGCGKSQDDDSEVPVYRSDIGFGLNGLAGSNWQEACFPSQDGERSFQTTIWFYDSSYEKRATSYDGPTCDAGFRRATYHYRYDNVAKIASDLDGWDSFRYDLSSLTLTLWSNELVSSYNAYEQYGHSDWSLNLAKDVAGLRFNSETEPEPTVGQGWIFTMKQDGEALYFAKYKDGTAVGEEPYVYQKL